MSEEERKRKAEWLLRRMKATPGQIFCGTLQALSGQYHTDPVKIELYVTRYYGMKDDESLRDALTRIYGPKVAAVAEELV